MKYQKYGILLLAIVALLALGGCELLPVAEGEAESGEDGQSSYFMLILMALIFVVFYFLMIRPQRKKQSAQKDLLGQLQKGDKVITIGGIYGEIDYVGEREVVLRIEGGNKLKVLKSSIMGKQQID